MHKSSLVLWAPLQSAFDAHALPKSSTVGGGGGTAGEGAIVCGAAGEGAVVGGAAGEGAGKV